MIWLFLAVFCVCSLIISVFMLRFEARDNMDLIENAENWEEKGNYSKEKSECEKSEDQGKDQGNDQEKGLNDKSEESKG